MNDLTRRQVIRYLAAIPVTLAFETGCDTVERASDAAQQALDQAASGEPFEPEFFDEHEWATLRELVDLIIPRDERSGSATDAGVPEYIDFVMIDQPGNQNRMREGLAWLDAEAVRRFQTDFVTAAETDRTAILDDVAWPDEASEEMQEGVRFFNTVRDLTASGFYTSRIGMDDLQYIGNVSVQLWEGCPPEALRKLGVSYEEDWAP